MRRNATRSFDALHPAVFFTLVYVITLFMAVFVCRTVYNSINGNEDFAGPVQQTQSVSKATAMNFVDHK